MFTHACLYLWSFTGVCSRVITVFSLYCSNCPLASYQGVLYQQYADDTQLFIALSPSNFTNNLNRRHLSELHAWFRRNRIALNAGMSNIIIVGTRQQLIKHSCLLQVSVTGAEITVSDLTFILSVTVDKNLTFDHLVKSVCKNSYYHIRAKFILSYTSTMPHLTDANRRYSEECSIFRRSVLDLTTPTRYFSV